MVREAGRQGEPLVRVLDPQPELLPLFVLRAGQAGSLLTGRTVLP